MALSDTDFNNLFNAVKNEQAQAGSSTPPAAQNYSGQPQGNTPPVIPITTATGNVQAPDLPPKPGSPATSDLNATATGVIAGGAMPQPTAQQPQKPTAPTATGNYKQDILNQIDYMGTVPGQVEEEFGLQDRLKASNTAKAALDAHNLEYATKYDKIRKQPGMTSGQAEVDIAALDRDRAYFTAALAMDFAAKNNDYTSMQALADKQVQLQLEPLKQKLDFYQTLQGQQFQLQRDQAERDYQDAKSLAQSEMDLKLSALGMMSPEKANKFVTNPTAKQAAARAGIIQGVQDYTNKLRQFDLDRLTKRDMKELETALNTTVGSAINVAQGQGAMGNEEAERILKNLRPKRTGTKFVYTSGQGVVDAQKSLLNNELDFLGVEYGNVKNLPMFSSALSDEEFFGSVSDSSNVPATEYFNITFN